MSSFSRIIELFRRFPGIGPKQAERFAYFLVSEREDYIKDLVRELETLKRESSICSSCFRYFAKNGGRQDMCSICSLNSRDASKLLLVSRDVDMENIERTKSYDGLYFILGGVVPILEKEPDEKIRIRELLSLIEKRSEDLKEIIIATNATTDGEHTAEFVTNRIRPLTEKFNIKVSMLGRGLSTGTELEYSDSDTIANALKNRS